MVSTMMLPQYILAFCRVIIGLTFAISAVGKLLNFSQFKQSILNFRILPKYLCNISAILFICGELVVVICMFLGGMFLSPGFALAIFLLLLFCIALASVLRRKIQTSCNCFGSAIKLVSNTDIWRNTGFILCAVLGYAITIWEGDSQKNLAHLSIIEWLLTGLGASVLTILWIQMSEILQLFRQD